MRTQALERVCSVGHAHSFGNITTPEQFMTEVEGLMKNASDGKHLLFVIGPRQEAAQKGINQLRKDGLAKRLCVLDTGHGGETKLWIVINKFRGIDPKKALK